MKKKPLPYLTSLLLYISHFTNLQFALADECNLYMAPSSIPNSGFGVYTTRTIEKDEPVTPLADAPSVIAIDMTAHTENPLSDFWTHVDYLWSGAGLGEFEASEVSENVFVLGCLSNFHTYLKNLLPHVTVYDDSYLDRSKDPGSGAFSYHEGHIFHASRRIEAGEELFADYGEEWLDTREGTFADKIPRREDFITAASVVSKLDKSMTRNKITMNDQFLSTMVDIISVFEHRVANAIPRSSSTLNDVNAKKSRKNSLHQLLAENTIIQRNITWIEENGICLERIKSGKSTIKQAGRGAFATGFIPKGSLISPMPLNTIIDRDFMLMYELVQDEETGERVKVEDSDPIGQQLIVNYCFGHEESKMLLCPMTNGILINHCSDRSVGEGHCKNKGPNAKIQWGTKWDEATSEWLDKSIEDISEHTKEGQRGLSLEVVATRDIAPGEEVFIDYGKNWEDAWDEHVESWQPPDPSDTGTYEQISTLRDDEDYRTLDESETNPYPDNVILVCYFPKCNEESEDNEEGEEKDFYGKSIRSDRDVDEEKELFECEVVDKPSDYWTVRVFCPDETTYLVSSYSNELVTFRMTPYFSDQHLPGAFRHYIEIEDELFPEHWKNDKKV